MRRQCSCGQGRRRCRQNFRRHSDVIVSRLSVTSKPAHRSPATRLWLAAGGSRPSSWPCSSSSSSRATAARQKPTPLPPLHPNRVGPESMFTAGAVLSSEHRRRCSTSCRALGVDCIHLYMHWADSRAAVRPRTHKPAFDANDPGAYSASGWAPFDPVDPRGRSPARSGLDLDAGRAAPACGRPGRGRPKPGHADCVEAQRRADFKQWVHAVGVPLQRALHPAGRLTLRCLASTSGRSGTSPTSARSSAPEADRMPLHGRGRPRRCYRAFVDAAWSLVPGHRSRP